MVHATVHLTPVTHFQERALGQGGYCELNMKVIMLNMQAIMLSAYAFLRTLRLLGSQ